ncbi:bifunctional metallophosphatase/5'-nucleotidase [Polyangium fumosum]|uniref:Bifunctional metallophosphatase/5'-nucleotidase n=1 Tax=Polyangium fumosum TaxID=889272 RepID=A0A4U1J621_9BACT|nr:bifunctional metallophosphatase/5'-nucleotidase [Polyangium fumosum]
MRFRRFLAPLLAAPLVATLALGSGCETSAPTPRLKGQTHLTLIHTSDIHSRLYPYNLQLGQVDAGLGLGEALSIANVGGAARISHIVGRERARASRVLHVDGGDCFQGAPVFNFFSGEAEIRALSAMGTDAMLVANHEFDRGALNLGIQLQNWASFPVLAANYLLEDPAQPGASPLGAVLQPYTVFHLDGLRVGLVGMGNLSSMTSIFDAPNRLGITPLNTVEVAQFYTDLLRPIVDVVVFVTHLGLDVDERMLQNTTGIDVVLGGHNHIVLQPPKRVRDCSAHFDAEVNSYYIELNDPNAETGKIRRYCRPRDVVLSHSGAFAKYVGRLDLVLSNDPADFPGASGGESEYDPVNGFEVVSKDYRLFPVTEDVPEDPIVLATLEPYAQSLDALANLDLLVGYARDGSRRFSTSGGDSPLGNMISTAMWLRLGVQTDFSLTNTTGIRADLVPGPVTVEQMYNIFPFDNSISKMQLSGVEVQDLFDFVARRSAGRGCVSQVQIAGARVVINCTQQKTPDSPPGVATNIYIGARNPKVACTSDAQCPDKGLGSCDVEAGVCWQPFDSLASYELATSNYLAAGGSGFRVLQRNTTQFDTQIQQRDALIDYIRAGEPCTIRPPCPADANNNGSQSDECGKLLGLPATCTNDGVCDHDEPIGCKVDADCEKLDKDFVCACPESVIEGDVCASDAARPCSAGTCVLRACRDDVAAFQRSVCENAPTAAIERECEQELAPCRTAGETCKYLACVDRFIGNFSDGRIRMVGQ